MKTFSLIIGTQQKQNLHGLAYGLDLLPGQTLEEEYVWCILLPVLNISGISLKRMSQVWKDNYIFWVLKFSQERQCSNSKWKCTFLHEMSKSSSKTEMRNYKYNNKRMTPT